MMAADITLQHTDVNGGVAVELNGATVQYGWKNLTNADPLIGHNDIAEVDYAGFENPTLSVQGIIDVDDITANRITQSLLMDFAQADTSTNKVVLTVTTGSIPTYLKGRPAAGYSVGGTYLNYMNCIVTGFSLTFGVPETREGQGWTYTITLLETR